MFESLPEGPFSTIVADPPWRYNDRLPGPGRGAAKHYSVLTTEDITDLPVAEVAAENAHLYLWVTNSFLEDALYIVKEWGFDYKTMITWEKVTKAGTTRIGMGHYFRNATEHLLFAVRGKLAVGQRNVPTIFKAQRTAHSAKPEEAYEIIRRMSPEPRLELFARKRREGFEVWGDEL